MHGGAVGVSPYVMTNLEARENLDVIIPFIERQGPLDRAA
jgi:hypothetical protein